MMVLVWQTLNSSQNLNSDVESGPVVCRYVLEGEIRD